MVQSIDFNSMRPVYNAVNIKIKKPEVNAGGREDMSFVTDNGIYNAVNIKIDNPAVNTEPKKCLYDYPEANEIITYDMAGIRPINTPVVEYHEAVVVTPENAESEDVATVPEPNYTTLEAEKSDNDSAEKKTLNSADSNSDVSFHGTENVKRPEIIPSEEILPEVDIAKVVANLTSSDLDVQAKQMEEIARLSMKNPQNAIPYIVKDVFSNLVEITKKDTSKLAPPSDKQIAIRQKLIADFIALERNPQAKQIPYQLSEQEIALASEISPMEQAERNKEYAIYTMAVLAKVYVDEVQKETGNVVPLTDIPGISATVDALRHSQNSGVKIAAIDALRYQQRAEYKDELKAIFTVAQTDKNPQVAQMAGIALNQTQKI